MYAFKHMYMYIFRICRSRGQKGKSGRGADRNSLPKFHLNSKQGWNCHQQARRGFWTFATSNGSSWLDTSGQRQTETSVRRFLDTSLLSRLREAHSIWYSNMYGIIPWMEKNKLLPLCRGKGAGIAYSYNATDV